MIIADDEYVKVSGVLLPGIFKSIEISGGALIEEIEVEGKGKKPKQATGYEDAKITIDLLLLDDMGETGEAKTKYDKLIVIQDLFKKSGQKKPVIHEIINEHITKRNIGKVVFKELSSRESSKKNELIASLVFWEHEEISITASKAGSNTVNASKSTLSQDYLTYLDNERGSAPKIQDKTSATPAYDLIAGNIDFPYLRAFE